MEKQKNSKLAEIAKNLFSKASGKYSASSTAQSAYIALECKKDGLDPVKLGKALLKDAPTLTAIIKIASHSHGNIPEDRRPAIGEDSVRRVIRSDFQFASVLMGLRKEQLDYILTELYEERSKANRSEDRYARVLSESEYRATVEAILSVSLGGSLKKLTSIFRRI